MAATKEQLEAISRYNLKTYARLDVRIPKELSAQLKEKCEKLGVSQRSVIIKAVEDFVNE